MGQEWPDAALDAVLPEMFFEAIERFPVELQDPARLWFATATAGADGDPRDRCDWSGCNAARTGCSVGHEQLASR
jgi:hypothetical protein